MIPQIILLSATLFGALAIILGAFGAHALKKIFTTDQMQSFETGVKYQMYHAIVLLVIGLQLKFETNLEQAMAWCFVTGVILFSFSIYGLCISSAKGTKIKILGPVTPLGGLCLLSGWILLFVRFLSPVI
ncbi:DUF423 domain-containing protein [Aquimarina agarilytica]|uniref:DUF423 domain-containing protein n=1 Tax=Aquimarina agarilytica TaxID=1087449 RepID=UPI00028A2AA3|nr:DUF423 domain-containing protein [Aquimarina agarilytica]